LRSLPSQSHSLHGRQFPCNSRYLLGSAWLLQESSTVYHSNRSGKKRKSTHLHMFRKTVRQPLFNHVNGSLSPEKTATGHGRRRRRKKRGRLRIQKHRLAAHPSCKRSPFASKHAHPLCKVPVARTALGAEYARQQIEICMASFLLKNHLLL
jgi:hypothetical protein